MKEELTVISCFPLVVVLVVLLLVLLLLLSQIPIATSGIRAMGYMMRHHLRTDGGAAVSQRTINQFVKVLLPEGGALSHSTSAVEKVTPGRSLAASWQLIGSVALSEDVMSPQLLQLFGSEQQTNRNNVRANH